MRVLANTAQIDSEFSRLIRECKSCQIAVAWATAAKDVKAINLLMKKHRAKIGKMVVGTHFYQTTPSFLRAFMNHEKVLFVPPDSDPLFHPKLYLFEMADGSWECIIGSPNLTSGGFSQNYEIATLITSDDDESENCVDALRQAMNLFSKEGKRFTSTDIDQYEIAWNRRRPDWNRLKGHPKVVHRTDGGIRFTTWPEFFSKIKEMDVHGLPERLKVIREARRLFRLNRHFTDISPEEQKGIAGITETENIRWHFFGRMRGKLSPALQEDTLSDALDLIPLDEDEDVGREAYLAFIEGFRNSFTDGKWDGIGGASRLLAMKRPDLFVCISTPNRDGLAEAFGRTINHKDYEPYWDYVVEQIKDSVWWKSPKPDAGEEREVWGARAAFLDSIYYQPKAP